MTPTIRLTACLGSLWLMACATAPAPRLMTITPTEPAVSSQIEVHPHLNEAFDQSRWEFVQADTRPVRTSTPDLRPGLDFDHGRLSGNTGCNTFHGEYRREDTRITLGRVASTRRYCQDLASQEQVLLSLLERTHYVMRVKSNGYLMLLDERRGILAELKPREAGAATGSR